MTRMTRVQVRLRVSCSPPSVGLHDFEQPGGTHAAADAHRDDYVSCLAPAALDQRVADEARARHAVGVAQRDGAAVDVQALVWDADAVAAVDHLHGEGLVQLPEIDVGDLLPGLLEELRHGEYRSDPHLARVAARHREAAEYAQRFNRKSTRLNSS